VNQLLWYVAHTRPRREKKLLQYCAREKLDASLPCYRLAHKYRGKTVVFKKPLFPGYVFLHIPAHKRGVVLQSDHLANLLEIADQDLFVRQTGRGHARVGNRFGNPSCADNRRRHARKNQKRPFAGIEGWVEKRYGMTTVLLRLDFISQAAAVKLEASDLELI
jgi:hypothetical protein